MNSAPGLELATVDQAAFVKNEGAVHLYGELKIVRGDETRHAFGMHQLDQQFEDAGGGAICGVVWGVCGGDGAAGSFAVAPCGERNRAGKARRVDYDRCAMVRGDCGGVGGGVAGESGEFGGGGSAG